ncbi:MAG TPA: hypothetical protein VLB27_01120, partial [candidate division Zixibacteria bacterium]|nr:hypothetical protein [candidate division Zixibacteria bacterium]
MPSIVSSHTSPLARSLTIAIALSAGLIVWSAGCDDQHAEREETAAAYCDSLDDLAASVDAALGLAEWAVWLGEDLDTLTAARASVSATLIAGDALAKTDDASSMAQDSATFRRLALARHWALAQAIECDTALGRLADSLRALVVTAPRNGAQDFRIDDTLNSARFRRQAFFSAYALGRSLNEWTERFIRLLNQRSQAQGYGSYLALQLDAADVQGEFVSAAIRELDSLTRLEYRVTLDSLRTRYAQRQLAAADVHFYANHGTETIQRILATVTKRSCVNGITEAYRKFGVTLEAFPLYLDSMDARGAILRPPLVLIHTPHDVRLPVGSLDRPADLTFATDLACRIGEGVALTRSQPLRYLTRRHPSALWSSALGMCLSELAFARGSLPTVARVRPDQWGVAHRWLQERRVINLRLSLVDAAFEREIYENPHRNMTQVYQQIYRDIMLVEPPEDFSRWSELFWGAGPGRCRFHTVVGEFIVAQILARGRRDYEESRDSREYVEFFFATYCAPGSTAPWTDLLLAGTGERLNSQYLYAQLRPLVTVGAE